MEKPQSLYHASAGYNLLSVIEPRAISVRNENEGEVVFATPSISYATCFLNRTDGSWVQIGRFSDDAPVHCIISDEQRFRSTDKGGTLYTLSSEPFYFEPGYDTGILEWVSKQAVTPLSYITYNSALEAMIENNVQVYFVNKDTFQKILNAEDQGLEILTSIESLNQIEGRNIIPLV